MSREGWENVTEGGGAGIGLGGGRRRREVPSSTYRGGGGGGGEVVEAEAEEEARRARESQQPVAVAVSSYPLRGMVCKEGDALRVCYRVLGMAYCVQLGEGGRGVGRLACEDEDKRIRSDKQTKAHRRVSVLLLDTTRFGRASVCRRGGWQRPRRHLIIILAAVGRFRFLFHHAKSHTEPPPQRAATAQQACRTVARTTTPS